MIHGPLIEHAYGCHTPACDRRVGKAWWKKMHPAPKGPKATASWFDDSGETACSNGNGGTLHYVYGFASRTLACGLRVAFSHAGHTVVGRVEDRGPFVDSRLFDLNPSLRAALECPDLCEVTYAVI